jgi:hypothetical protein
MTYAAGPICIDELVTVLGQYDPEIRWNGWLCPRIDAGAVEEVMRALASEPSDQYAPTHGWRQDGALVLIEWDGEDSYVEILEPDEDGLYSLGAHSWVWSVDSEADTVGNSRT